MNNCERSLRHPPLGFYITAVLAAFIIPFINHYLLNRICYEIGTSGLKIPGTQVYAYEAVQNAVIPFINMVCVFVLCGLICHTVLRFSVKDAVTFLIIGVISLMLPYALSMYALSAYYGENFADTVKIYSESGYISLMIINWAVSAADMAVCLVVAALIRSSEKRRGRFNASSVGTNGEVYSSSNPLLRSLLLADVVTLIPEFIGDITETASNFIEVGLPINSAEVMYIIDPYITIIIYAICGYFTMLVFSIFYQKMCKNSKKYIKKP